MQYLWNFDGCFLSWSKQQKMSLRYNHWDNRIILQLNGTFCREFIPMIFHWFICIQYQEFLSTSGSCLKVVFEFLCRSTFLWGPNQWSGRFLGITGWDLSVCNSNRLHVDILRFSFTKLGYIPINSFKLTGNFPAVLNFNRFFLKLNRFICN